MSHALAREPKNVGEYINMESGTDLLKALEVSDQGLGGMSGCEENIFILRFLHVNKLLMIQHSCAPSSSARRAILSVPYVWSFADLKLEISDAVDGRK